MEEELNRVLQIRNIDEKLECLLYFSDILRTLITEKNEKLDALTVKYKLDKYLKENE